GYTLPPGRCPPSPGFAPWAILIWISRALTRYLDVTPNRPEATCLMAELRSVPRRSISSPPSPEFDFPCRRFMARARVSWASLEMDPYDMAPVLNRVTMESTLSTSSMGTPFLG